MVTNDFFSAIKNGKEEMMADLYPGIDNLKNYYKSDTIMINKVIRLDDNKYKVYLINKFTNGFGKITESKICLFTKPKNPEKPSSGYVIYDSKGLCDFSNDAVYKFAKRKGYIKGNTLTDQGVATKYKEALSELFTIAWKFSNYLQKNVKVTNWNWESSYYGYSASGRGVVKNNTSYSIPKVKYIVTYKKSNGTMVTQDNGIVTYDEIRPYSMTSFFFYTPYVGNASKASIKLEFDDEFIFQTVANGYFE